MEIHSSNARFRKLGIDNMLWGTHICLFYRTDNDLLEVLLPFFKTGLTNNELCVWITPESLSSKDALDALKKEITDIDKFVRSGQMEILNNCDLYNGTYLMPTVCLTSGCIKNQKR